MDSRYTIGDTVIHPYHGAGKIKEIIQEEFLGSTEHFYLIEMNKFSIKIPVKKTEEIGLRNIVSIDMLEQIYSYLLQPVLIEKENWHSLYLKYKENIKINLMSTILVLKKLYYFSKQRLLKPEEVKLLFLVKKIVVEEIHVAGNESRDDILNRINSNMKVFLAKMETNRFPDVVH
ncbi:hypothetical protein KAJ27_04025 [bacterium]|nr:hypothetical protein [bacterium]